MSTQEEAKRRNTKIERTSLIILVFIEGVTIWIYHILNLSKWAYVWEAFIHSEKFKTQKILQSTLVC